MSKELWEGNQAMAEACVRAGLQGYFGYPITPQTEILEYMSARMPELGRAFVQAESELAAINMVYGAACTGVRVMTSSSSPGISLIDGGAVVHRRHGGAGLMMNVMRGGPGLGNIAPPREITTRRLRRRAWRLPSDRAGAGFHRGSGRPGAGSVRDCPPLPHPSAAC